MTFALVLHVLVGLSPVLAFLALSAWAFASPLGAAPDDDYHLVSTWCAVGGSEECRPGTEDTTRSMDSEFGEVTCYAGLPKTFRADRGEVQLHPEAAKRLIREVRSPEWRQAFLALPLAQRKAQIEALRRESEAQKRIKPMEIMDVNPAAVLQALTFHRCTRLIHGHTHRPSHHLLEIDGRACERWVLPDWYENGGYLACDAEGCQLLAWPA